MNVAEIEIWASPEWATLRPRLSLDRARPSRWQHDQAFRRCGEDGRELAVNFYEVRVGVSA